MSNRKINQEKLEKLFIELKAIANGNEDLELMIEEFQYAMDESFWTPEVKIFNVHSFVNMFYASMGVNRHESLSNIALNLITDNA